MKIVVAIGKNIKGSERKARIPARIVKGMKALDALDILKYTPKRMAKEISKVLMSAVANASHNYKIEAENLIIKNVRIDKSMRLKRVEYKAKGSTAIKQKPFCHITVELEDITQRNVADTKVVEVKKPKKVEAEKVVVTKKTTDKKVKTVKKEAK